MRYSASATALNALTVLCLTSCSVSRRASSSEHNSQLRVKSEELKVERDSVAVVVRNTITITKTVTVDRNDKGDTLRIATETDRYRGHDVQKLKVKSEKLRVVHDTVYIEKRDSVTVSSKLISGKPNTVNSKRSTVNQTLKWLFWSIIALIALLITLRILKR